MSVEKIIAALEPHWSGMKDLMDKALHSDVALLNGINRSLLENGGKCLRPMLSLLMAGACGEINEKSERIAAASEILHNATLIHDDIADNSSCRRGRPTVMSLLGPSPAVLVGDYWLAKSVDLIVGDDADKRIIGLFSKTLEDLAEGEMLQLEKAQKMDITIPEYFRIIYCKTATLFETAVVSGAMTVGADEKQIQAAKQYASAVGTAFQIKDDILDYEGDESLGKPVGADLKEGKITLPLLMAFEGSDREAEMRCLAGKAADAADVRSRIIEFVKDNDGIAKAAECLDGYVEKAVAALDALPSSIKKEHLVQLARYNSIRTV